MSSADSASRVEKIEAIEKDIASVLESAGCVFEELAKDSASQNWQPHATQFLTLLQKVETDLMEQITYLGQVSSGNASSSALRVSELEFANLRRSTDEVHSCLQRRLAAASASVAKFAGNMNAEAAAMKTADAADGCDPSTGDSPMDSS